MPNGPVLYCYDGSEHAQRALTTAHALLGERPAVVLTVWAPAMRPVIAAGYMAIPASVISETDEAIERDAQATCEAGQKLLGPTARGRVERVIGSAWPTILEIADQLDAELIVVGTRGRGALASTVLGSVSHGLANHGKRPLLIVPDPA